MAEGKTAGVYVVGRDGRPAPVHEYLNDNYALADVAEILQYGELSEGDDGDVTLTLSRKEITDVKNTIDASSFDYDEGFVELCLDMHRAAAELPGGTVTFVEKL